MKFPLYQIDAFASRVFAGNPAEPAAWGATIARVRASQRPHGAVAAIVAAQRKVQMDIAATGDRVAALEDLCWAVINANEFLFQH